MKANNHATALSGAQITHVSDSLLNFIGVSRVESVDVLGFGQLKLAPKKIM